MEIRKILAPIDFSGRSLEELRWATTMANIFGAKLITLHVVPPETVEVYAREGKDWKSASPGWSTRSISSPAIPTRRYSTRFVSTISISS